MFLRGKREGKKAREEAWRVTGREGEGWDVAAPPRLGTAGGKATARGRPHAWRGSSASAGAANSGRFSNAGRGCGARGGGAAAERRALHLSAGPRRPRVSPAATARLRAPHPAFCPAPRGDSGDPGCPRLGFYRNRKGAQVPCLPKSVVPAFRLTRSLNPSC